MTPRPLPPFAEILSAAALPLYRAVLCRMQATRNRQTERRITQSSTKSNTPLKTLRR
jgi:hypothetical protein